MKFLKSSMLSAAAVIVASQASAADLEVTHWWTSGGEAAAVAEFAKAFNATEHTWIDGAIAGSGGTARSNYYFAYPWRRPNARNTVEPRPSG